MISLDKVNVVYANGTHAISDISAHLHPQRIIGIVGMNGAGKSTLFKTIMGIIKPTQGHVYIANQNIETALKQNWIAYVPQSAEIDWNFPVLVKDVVMMGRYGYMGFLRKPRKEDFIEVDKALERVKLTEYKHRQIGELSGGQKRRMFVARAIAQNSRIVLLDEPFAGVDIQTEKSLTELFRQLAKEGHLILVSTHNLGSVPDFCDEVILINKHIIAQGDIASTFNAHNLNLTFGGMLRHLNITKTQLHADADEREVTILTDDERPLLFYGDEEKTDIVDPSSRD